MERSGASENIIIADGLEVSREALLSFFEADSGVTGYKATNRAIYFNLSGASQEEQIASMLSGRHRSDPSQPRIEQLDTHVWVIVADEERQWLVDTSTLHGLANGETILE